jgi:hypothetical protein
MKKLGGKQVKPPTRVSFNSHLAPFSIAGRLCLPTLVPRFNLGTRIPRLRLLLKLVQDLITTNLEAEVKLTHIPNVSAMVLPWETKIHPNYAKAWKSPLPIHKLCQQEPHNALAKGLWVDLVADFYTLDF